MTYFYSQMKWNRVDELMPIISVASTEFNPLANRAGYTDEREYYLVASGSRPTIRIALYDGEEWVSPENYVVDGVFAWAWLPRPPFGLCDNWNEETRSAISETNGIS